MTNPLKEFSDAYSQFREAIIELDPSLEAKLEREDWQDEIAEKVEKIENLFGATLLEPSDNLSPLSFHEDHYGERTVLKDGSFTRAYGKQTPEQKIQLPRWYHGSTWFWNPVVIEQHLKAFDENYQPLEDILKVDPGLLDIMETVHSNEWTEFLEKNGYKGHKEIPDLEEIRKRKKVFMKSETSEGIKKAYALIVEKKDAIEGEVKRFHERFPNFGEVLDELDRLRYSRKFCRDGRSIESALKNIGFFEISDQAGRGDKIVSEGSAESVMELYGELKGVEFKKYAELKELHPGLDEKVQYIQKSNAKLRIPGISAEGLNELREKDWRFTGKGRFRRGRQVPSSNLFDPRILNAVNQVYDILLITEKVYGMIESHNRRDVLFKVVKGVASENSRYWKGEPYIMEGRNYTKGDLLNLIKYSSNGNPSFNDTLSGRSDSYKIDSHWYKKLEADSRKVERKPNGQEGPVVSERQLPFFRAMLTEIGSMVNKAISLYRQSA